MIHSAWWPGVRGRLGAGPWNPSNLAFGSSRNRVFHGQEEKTAPPLPLTRQPHSVIGSPSSTSLGGFSPPLYQATFTGGSVPRAGNSYFTTMRRG